MSDESKVKSEESKVKEEPKVKEVSKGKEDSKINISTIVGSLIDDTTPSAPTTEEHENEFDSPSTSTPETTSSPIPPKQSTPPNPSARKEQAKVYQREYRKRQKLEKELLREAQVKGSEILMVFSNGQIVSRELHNEDEYIEMLTDFSESLKKQGSLLSFRISQRSF